MINEPAKDSEVTPAAEEEETTTNNNNTDSSVQTGDSFDPVLVTMIMLIALGGLAGIAVYKKKEDNR
ncbi:MAG: LPXTG cell wall anchor domain-containing protein [Eubacterium sp.]|nr:LPXTG cell wall anchor domain-containing protein [Eubacterium sp.]